MMMLTPVDRHAGINDHPGAGFHQMVSCSADFPFRTRVLLPMLIDTVRSIFPHSVNDGLSATVRDSRVGSWLFKRLHWETHLALPYVIASFLMLFSLIGFAHYTSRLTIQQCGLHNVPRIAITLSIATLVGLPALFKFTAFLYDPPQLLIFAGALFYLGEGRLLPFFLFFVLGALNKETSILLIPLTYVFRSHRSNHSHNGLICLALILIYGLLRIPLYMTPGAHGAFPVSHLFDHNVQWLFQGYGPIELVIAVSIMRWLSFGWSEKPLLLRLSLVLLLLPLLGFGMIFGYIDEWRDYFEAYPACFGLLTHTFVGRSRQRNSPDDYSIRTSY